MSWSRRRFLNTSLASSTLVAMGSTTIPTFLGRSAEAARGRQGERTDPGRRAAPGGKRRLEHRRAPRNRRLQPRAPGTAAARRATAQDHAGDRPAPRDGRDGKMLERGRLAVVQGVGYPNPDRSHFRSMEIWESASVENDARALETGWLGRALDARPQSRATIRPALHVGGRSLPLALKTRKTEVPSVESLESYKLQLAGTDKEKQAERIALNQLAGIDRRERRPTSGLHQPAPPWPPTSRAAGWNSSPRRSRAGPSIPISAWPGGSS